MKDASNTMIALLEAHKAGLWSPKNWGPNVIAGIIVGIVAMPLAMAFAIASGATPQQGLYTSIVAGACAALFGGSRLQVTGPTGAFVVILAGITSKYGIQGLQIATAMAGVMLVAMGMAKIGGVIKFIPDPVIVGFTAGIGTIIFVGQWKDFFGLPATAGSHFHEKFLHLLESLPQLDPRTSAIGALSLFILLVFPRLRGPRNRWRFLHLLQKIPAPMVALIVATAIQSTLSFPSVATIGSTYGGISRSLPSFELLPINLTTLLQLVGPAFAIALLGSIESLLSAVVADGMAGTRHDSNQELIGQGIANIVSPLFGGFAATGALARTATNIRSGATSPIASLVHCVTLVLIILIAAPLAYNIPLCSLAAILFVVAWNMAELPHLFSILRKAPKADIATLAITFLLTVFVDLITAVYIGVIVASLLFMKRMASSVKVHRDTHTTISDELQS
ncbi:MAG TPA: SulP family inorganic anion transporter, partial [Opitutales bacterium]|nr:SulP family inorganic anion transporter [Opitutales bacterium]